MDIREFTRREKTAWPNRLCDKFDRIKRPHDPEHIIFILDRVLTKLRPKVEEDEF